MSDKNAKENSLTEKLSLAATTTTTTFAKAAAQRTKVSEEHTLCVVCFREPIDRPIKVHKTTALAEQLSYFVQWPLVRDPCKPACAQPYRWRTQLVGRSCGNGKMNERIETIAAMCKSFDALARSLKCLRQRPVCARPMTRIILLATNDCTHVFAAKTYPSR